MSSKAIEKSDGVKANTSSLCGSNVKLRRELGLFSAVNLILGVMIGSGIFVSPASALDHSGSVALCLIVWTVSGVISLLGALSFAELGTVLGKSGAEYSYFQAAFGKMHKYWGPLPSFICAWIYVVILRPAEVAIIVMTFAEYAMQPFTTDLQADYKSTAIKLCSLSALYIMSSNLNLETSRALSREIKNLQQKCLDTCNIIENSSPEVILPNNVGEKALCYVEGARLQIQKSDTVIPTDENLIINQFLAEMKEKTEEIEKLTAYTRGAVLDVENEIERLKSHTKMVEGALSKPHEDNGGLGLEQIAEAKENFQMLKGELHRLIQSVFRNDRDLVADITGQLMQERINEESDGYIPVTDDTFRITELLKDINIVSSHPYNNNKIKLAY